MSLFWKILLGVVAAYYLYVVWVLVQKKKVKTKKNTKKDKYLQINGNFVNNTPDEQVDLKTILSQTDEVENNSKLLEAFKKSSKGEDINVNSLTRKKDEKFKIIRGKDSADKTNSDHQT